VTHSAYRRMLHEGTQVPMDQLQPGDLLFFQNTNWPGLSHVGIYIGDGKFVHAEYYGVGVTVSSLSNDPRDANYWSVHYRTANRPWMTT
jgi:cell wall-associated NlpC family hydrolase